MFIKHSFRWCAIFYEHFENTEQMFDHRIWHLPWLFLRFRWGIKYLGKSLLFRFFVPVTLFLIFFSLLSYSMFNLWWLWFWVEEDNELLQENEVISEELDKRVLCLCFLWLSSCVLIYLFLFMSYYTPYWHLSTGFSSREVGLIVKILICLW